MKKLAGSIGRVLSAKGYDVPHSVLLHGLAAAAGYTNWHVLAAVKTAGVSGMSVLTAADLAYLRALVGAEETLQEESRHLSGVRAPQGLLFRLGTLPAAPAPSHWDEDSEFPVADWRYEIANDDTRLGYREWVEHQRECARPVEA
jgi:hypothetical protein